MTSRYSMRSSPRAAFTMVEVVIALGICAFSVIAIAGLLGMTLSTARSSSSDVMVATMTATVLAELRNQPFDDLEASLQGDGNLSYAFSTDGTPVPTSSSEAVYLCTVKQSTSGPSSANLMTCLLEFTWPPRAVEPNRQIVQVLIARYE